jgi:hypothetical protein
MSKPLRVGRITEALQGRRPVRQLRCVSSSEEDFQPGADRRLNSLGKQQRDLHTGGLLIGGGNSAPEAHFAATLDFEKMFLIWGQRYNDNAAEDL